MVDPITLQHVGFAVGVIGIVLATKALFDIAESAKQIARYYPLDDDDEQDESPASAVAPATPSAQTIDEVSTAHVNPDIMTKPPQGSVTVTTLNYGAST
jgi:hypothetical protein